MIFRGRQAHNICAGRPLKMFAYQHIICYNILDCGQIDVTETTEKYIRRSIICFSVVSETPACMESHFKKEKAMYKKFEMELAGRTLRVDVGRVAKQANGAVLMHYGDTTVLCTATASEKPRDGIDFFPLSVEYNERMYAVGKIPGGFNKREGKASENAILTDRVIDRPMRPLFPKDYRNDVTLENLVLSVDQDCSPELTAMLGAAIATCISDIPFDGPISTTQVGLIDGEFVFNPTSEQREASDLALTVASTKEKVIMIEAGANEVPEDKMIEAIFAAHDLNQKVIAFIDTIVAECGKPKHEYEHFAVPEELFEAIKEIVPPEQMEEAVFTDDKQTREENIRVITEKLEEAFADNEEWLSVLGEAVYQYQKKTVRKMILKDHKRPDGRAVDQIRPLAAEVDLIPRVHGSAMFTRGQTQICNVTTLAPLSEAQRLDGLDESQEDRDAARSDTARWLRERLSRCSRARRSSRMRSVQYPRHLSQTDPHPRRVCVHPVCH